MKTTKTVLIVVLVIVITIVLFTITGMLGIALRNIAEDLDEPQKLHLGNSYYLMYNSSWRLAEIIYESNPIIIDMEIVAWNFDSTFIIVKQKPFFSILDSISAKYPNLPLNKQLELYDAVEIYNYWIIDKRVKLECDTIKKRYDGIVYGPFSKKDYLEKRKELNVPYSLKLLKTEKKSFDSPIHYLLYKWFCIPPARERVVE
jgi:hypothetical protein